MWHLEKLSARGGMLGSTTVNTFEGHRFPSEEDLLVRETTQNAIDNPAGGRKPRLVFRLVSLSGAKKQAFLRDVAMDSLYGNRSLVTKCSSFSELRKIDNAASLGLLYIEDFNTTGLDGRIEDPTGNWMRFNLHGDAQKLEEEEKIGSYGYGKSVLSRAAGTNTFMVYTRIQPNTRDRHEARLMGHTFQAWFPDGAMHRSGRGWFCERVDSEQDPLPFTGGKATSLASLLGFTPRASDDTGTSFLLIGTAPGLKQITMPAIRRAFETWWWPSLLDDRLDIELWENGVKQPGPSPRLRTDLKPYIDCKSKLDTGVGKDVQLTPFNKAHGRKLGQLALMLSADESIFESPLHPKSPGPRRVARMRKRSGMVTEYREFGTARRVSFVGFYSGDEDIDNALKFSEPSTHDEWSRVSQRLARIKHGPELVNAVEERTQNACYAFQRKYSAARGPLAERLPELERLLGAAFASREHGPRIPQTGGRKNERITILELPAGTAHGPAVIYGKKTNVVDGLVRYRLRDGYRKRKKVRVWLSLNVAEDAQRIKGAPLAVRVTDAASSRVIYSGNDPIFDLDLVPGKTRTLRVRSGAYPKHQVLIFDEGEVIA